MKETLTFTEATPKRANPVAGRKDIPAQAKTGDGRSFGLGYNAEPLATIMATLGQPLEVEFDEKQEGNYVKRYVKSVTPAGGARESVASNGASRQLAHQPSSVGLRLTALSAASRVYQGLGADADYLLTLADSLLAWVSGGDATAAVRPAASAAASAPYAPDPDDDERMASLTEIPF